MTCDNKCSGLPGETQEPVFRYDNSHGRARFDYYLHGSSGGIVHDKMSRSYGEFLGAFGYIKYFQITFPHVFVHRMTAPYPGRKSLPIKEDFQVLRIKEKPFPPGCSNFVIHAQSPGFTVFNKTLRSPGRHFFSYLLPAVNDSIFLVIIPSHLVHPKDPFMTAVDEIQVEGTLVPLPFRNKLNISMVHSPSEALAVSRCTALSFLAFFHPGDSVRDGGKWISVMVAPACKYHHLLVYLR